jgi:hypothetical protein
VALRKPASRPYQSEHQGETHSTKTQLHAELCDDAGLFNFSGVQQISSRAFSLILVSSFAKAIPHRDRIAALVQTVGGRGRGDHRTSTEMSWGRETAPFPRPHPQEQNAAVYTKVWTHLVDTPYQLRILPRLSLRLLTVTPIVQIAHSH